MANDCTIRVKECEALVNLTREINRQQLKSIAELTEITSELNNENQRLLERNIFLEKQDDVWYKNPFIIGILGFSAGVLAHELAQ